MLFKKFLCTAAAAAIAVSCVSVTAFADAEEKKEIPFTYDVTLTTTESGAPAVSFDTDDWEKYVHVTPDSEKIGLKITQDKKTYYQGFSLKATASDSQKNELYLNAGSVRDADNNLVYPDAEKEDATFICPGVELRCEDFGLSCFDGCFVTFAYKIGADVENKVMGNTVYAFATDEEYQSTFSTVVPLQYDVLMNNNVKQYRQQSLTVPANAAATRIVFETPVTAKMDSDVLCLDNISIMIPAEDGSNLYIKSLDGYNASAKAQETIDAIEIKEKSEKVELADTPEKQEQSNKAVVIIIVVVVVAALGVGGFFFIRKKKKFY